MKKPLLISISIGMVCASMAQAANFQRSGGVTEKEWDNKSPLVFGSLTYPPENEDNCNWNEGPLGDLVLNFDISVLSRLAGSAFDVNKLYFDGVATGEWALDAWFLARGSSNIPSLNGNNWGNRSVVSFCVGTIAQGVTGGGDALESIVMWYDGPVSTTVYPKKPKPNESPHSDIHRKNTANHGDSLNVSDNGITLRDLHQTPPSGTAPGSISGPRVDLEPDFDVYDTNGNEISANCNNCMGKSVDVGQTVHAKLKTEVSNADAKDFKRSSSSETIEGPVWWMIEGKTGWNLLDSGEYTISNLNEGAATVETHVWAIPNYPGDILAMKACVDGDDEIWEEDEASGSGNDIDNPDQSGTSNNCSRRERFYIEHPNYTPTGTIESGTCTRVMGWTKDQNTTGSVMVHAYISEPDGSNEQYLESLMADKPKSTQGGNYGIDWSIPEAVKVSVAKKLTFRAVNTPEGTNPVIGSVTLTCVPEMTLDGKAAVQILNAH